MSLGPQARIVDLQKKTSLSQLLNPQSSSSSSSVASAHQVQQGHPQAYSNVSYERSQPTEYHYRRGEENRYYEQNGRIEWAGGCADERSGKREGE